MGLIAIYNPVCGDRTAKGFFDKYVLPLLKEADITATKTVGTEYAGHSGEIIKDALLNHTGDLTVILGSGDGTLHEIINFLSMSAEFTTPPKITFSLVPCGTANALYSSLYPPKGLDVDTPEYRLQGLKAMIDGSRAIPLTLAITTLSPPPNATRKPSAVASAVVVSTCFHASILYDSEKLRSEIPGLERFKVAAKQNFNKWYNSYAKFLPASAQGVVEIYDPNSKKFVPHPDSDEDDPIVDMYGPFAYFLATVNVDRLEYAFRISPLAKDITPTEATCDVIVVRPLRDPSLSWDSPEGRDAFTVKLARVMGGAYQDGTHVNLRYSETGGIDGEGDGPFVVEYIRCGGWEWIPDDADAGSHILCSDGLISEIEKGGRAVCTAATPHADNGFFVYGP